MIHIHDTAFTAPNCSYHVLGRFDAYRYAGYAIRISGRVEAHTASGVL